MGVDQSCQFCWVCNRPTLHARPQPNHILHLLLSLATGGIWLIVWVAICFQYRGWRCQTCGFQERPHHLAFSGPGFCGRCNANTLHRGSYHRIPHALYLGAALVLVFFVPVLAGLTVLAWIVHGTAGLFVEPENRCTECGHNTSLPSPFERLAGAIGRASRTRGVSAPPRRPLSATRQAELQAYLAGPPAEPAARPAPPIPQPPPVQRRLR